MATKKQRQALEEVEFKINQARNLLFENEPTDNPLVSERWKALRQALFTASVAAGTLLYATKE